jgi:archaellum component FlaG (FlaF/FlaG flagellin family)
LGFASIGAFIMMFFSILLIVSAFAIINGRMVASTQLALETEKERLEIVQETSIDVLSASYDAIGKESSIIVNNTGKRKIDPTYIDVWIDGIRVPRTSRTVSFEGENSVNPLHWDPGEQVRVDAQQELQAGNHTATVSTEEGIQDSLGFET